MVVVNALRGWLLPVAWVARFHLLQWHEAYWLALTSMILLNDPLSFTNTKACAAAV